MEKAAAVRSAISISIRLIRGQNGPAWGTVRKSISTIERNRADSIPVFFCERLGKILKLALAHGSCHCSPLKPRCILAAPNPSIRSLRYQTKPSPLDAKAISSGPPTLCPLPQLQSVASYTGPVSTVDRKNEIEETHKRLGRRTSLAAGRRASSVAMEPGGAALLIDAKEERAARPYEGFRRASAS